MKLDPFPVNIHSQFSFNARDVDLNIAMPYRKCRMYLTIDGPAEVSRFAGVLAGLILGLYFRFAH